MTQHFYDESLTVINRLPSRTLLLLTLLLMVIFSPSQAMATPEIEVWAGTEAEVTAGTAMEITDGQAIPVLGGLAANETTMSPARTFTIRNMGTALLKITSLSISQPNIGNPFSQPVLSSADILPGGMATFQTVFNPQLAIQPVLYQRTYPATVQIFNTDSDEGLFNFTVIGQVRMQESTEAPRFMVLDGTTRVNTGDIVTIGTTSVGKPFSKTLTLWNFTRGTPETIQLLPNPGDLIKLTGPNPTEFEVVPFTTNTLALGQFTPFTVTLKGNTSSPATGHLATVSFTSNDPLFSGANPPFTFDIKGIVATIPEINVTEGTTAIVDDMTTVDFGTYLVNATTDTTKTFTLAEVGGSNLTLSNLLLPTGFSLVGTFPTAIPANSSATVTVKLDTSKANTFNGEIVFNNNDGNGDENPFNIKVKGTIVGNLTDPEIEVWQGTAAEVTAGTAVAITDGQALAVDFSTILNGTPPVKTFTVKNGGGAILQLTALSPLPAGFSLVTPFPQSIPANGTASFSVRLDNTTLEHTYSGMIQIFSNDSASDGSIENPFDFPIKGVVSAAKPELEVLVEGTGSITDGQTDIIGLGNTVIGQPLQRTFTVKNSGTADLALSPVAFDQGGDGFTINSFKISTLAPGTETTFTISLDAATAGIFSGVLSFGNNDGDENPFNFALSATVDQAVSTAQEIQVWQDSPATTEVIDGQALPIDFGETPVGTPVVKTFTVKNIGAVGTTLSLTNLALSPDNSKFTLKGDLAPSIVGPEGKIAFTIQFDSTVAGIFEAKLTLFNNDADENPFDFSIQATALGKATTPEIEVFDEATEVVDGTTTIDFGAATVKTFTVQNKGNADLTVDTVTFSAGGNGFKLESFVPATLAPGESTAFKVTVTTTAVGEYTGTLSFANNDADENPFNFDIKAAINATAGPEIQVLDGTLDIVDNETTVDYGTATAKTFTIKNIGNAPFTANKAVTFVDGGNGFTITSFQVPLTLAPQETTTFQVAVNTTQAGTYTGTLAFENNDGDENPFNFSIKATLDPLTSQCDVNNLVQCKTETSCAAVGGVFTLDRCNVARFLIHPQKGTSIALANTAKQTWNTPTLFAGGTSIDGSALFPNMDVSAAQTITWAGNVTIDPTYVGQTANLLFVVGIEPPSLDDPLGYSGNEDTQYFAFDSVLKSFFPVNVYVSEVEWPTQLAKLTAQPFKDNVVLAEHVSLDLWTGKIGELVTGLTANTGNKARIYTFFGYVLADGTIIYNGMPIMTTLNP